MLNVKVSGFPHPEGAATRLQSPLIMFTKINGSCAGSTLSEQGKKSV
jgi:hypothetical protein